MNRIIEGDRQMQRFRPVKRLARILKGTAECDDVPAIQISGRQIVLGVVGYRVVSVDEIGIKGTLNKYIYNQGDAYIFYIGIPLQYPGGTRKQNGDSVAI